MNSASYPYLEEVNLGILKFTGKGQRILDVGCGFGVLGEELKKRGNYVVGLDINEYVIGIARRRIDEAYLVDATRVETLPLPKEKRFGIY